MNMRKKAVVVITVILLFNTLFSLPVNAEESTSYTMSPTINGVGFQVMQDAYLPTAVFQDMGLQAAEDMDVRGHTAYIADTGNKRVVILDLHTGAYRIIGEGLLNKPTGVAVDRQGRIYVADYNNREAYRFSASGELEITFTKPDTPKFGLNSKFIPRKITPTISGGAYLIVEGAAGGIVRMNDQGEFMGYYASNIVQVSTFELFLEKILTEEQMRFFKKKTPESYGNLTTDKDGLLYTVNLGKQNRILKHSLNGVGMQGMIRAQYPISDAVDIVVNDDGNIFAVDTLGHVIEMSNMGIWYCVFGGKSTEFERLGLFDSPSGLGVDDDGVIYVLDKERNTIQGFAPTASQTRIHNAINAYNSGNYILARQLFSEALIGNDASYYAHVYMGRIEMHDGNYEEAAAHFRTANNREEYSQAFWKIRNQWIQAYVPIAALALVLFFLIVRVIRFFLHKKVRPGYKNAAFRTLSSNRYINDFMYLKYEFLHPIDNAYEVSVGHRGNVITASFIFILLFMLFVVSRLCSGFIFSIPANEFPLWLYTGGYTGIILLFVIGNHLITSIQDGKGTLRSIYITVAYSLTPLIIALPIITMLNNVSTYNEYFISQTILTISTAWSVLNICLSLAQIHDYRFWKFIKTTLLTIGFMAVAVLLASLFYLLAKQFIDFVLQVYTEVIVRD